MHIPFVLVTFAIVVMVGGIATYVSIRNRNRENREAVAARFNGQIKPGHIEFRVNGARVKLYLRQGGPRNTHLRFHWNPGGTLCIRRRGLWQTLQGWMGAPSIETPDREFNKRFFVQGDPEEWVRNILDLETRQNLVRMSIIGSLQGNATGFQMEAGPSGVIVQSRENLLADSVRLMEFVGIGLDVFGSLHTPVSRLVRILSVKVDLGRCPVCARDVRKDARYCPTCQTPHHQDCWSYLGGCAIFGCAARPSGKERPRRDRRRGA